MIGYNISAGGSESGTNESPLLRTISFWTILITSHFRLYREHKKFFERWSSPTESAVTHTSDFFTISINWDKTKSGDCSSKLYFGEIRIIYFSPSVQNRTLYPIIMADSFSEFKVWYHWQQKKTSTLLGGSYKLKLSESLWTTFEPQGRVGQTRAKLGGLTIFDFKMVSFHNWREKYSRMTAIFISPILSKNIENSIARCQLFKFGSIHTICHKTVIHCKDGSLIVILYTCTKKNKFYNA